MCMYISIQYMADIYILCELKIKDISGMACMYNICLYNIYRRH